MKTIITALIVVAGLYLLSSTVYVVDETEQVVITQFGEAIGEPVTTSGINWKLPWQKPNFFLKNLLEWDGEPGQVPTKDKTFIWVDTFGRWRIVDPRRYFEKVNNETSAHATLDGIIDAAVRNLVTSYDLIETVRSTDRALAIEVDTTGANSTRRVTKINLGRRKMAQEILKQAAPKLAEFGIELVDVQFKRINYNEKVLQDVYSRMIAERNQIAEKYRSEGRGESAKIKGEKEKELKRISSEAYREAQVLKGDADASATETYASAYNRDPEFYSFLKTLDIYRESLDSSATTILSTDSDFFKYLKEFAPR